MTQEFDQNIDLNKQLERLSAPAPKDDLKARILAAAEATPQIPETANDRRFDWKKISALAACLVVMGFTGLQFMGPADPQVTDEWEIAADESGFSELYDWVHAEETALN